MIDESKCSLSTLELLLNIVVCNNSEGVLVASYLDILQVNSISLSQTKLTIASRMRTTSKSY